MIKDFDSSFIEEFPIEILKKVGQVGKGLGKNLQMRTKTVRVVMKTNHYRLEYRPEKLEHLR